MRVIDADALLERMMKDPLFPFVERYGVSGVIEAEPTVDAVEVVRCEDCLHNRVTSWNHGERDKPQCHFTDFVRSNKFYCRFGERRQNERSDKQAGGAKMEEKSDE